MASLRLRDAIFPRSLWGPVLTLGYAAACSNADRANRTYDPILQNNGANVTATSTGVGGAMTAIGSTGTGAMGTTGQVGLIPTTVTSSTSTTGDTTASGGTQGIGDTVVTENCASTTVTATDITVVKPADIVFAIDGSGSMNEEIMFVQQYMNDFSQQIVDSGIDIRVLLLGSPTGVANQGMGMGNQNGICIGAPLGSGTCPEDTNLPTFVHIATPDLLGFFALKLARKNNIPVVSTYHTHFSSYLKYYKLGMLERYLWKYLVRFYRQCEQIYFPT